MRDKHIKTVLWLVFSTVLISASLANPFKKASADIIFDTYDKDDVLVNVATNGTAYGLDLMWKQPYTGLYDEFGSVAIENDIGYVCGKSVDGYAGLEYITAFHVEDGSQIWSTWIGDCDGTPLIDSQSNNFIYIDVYTDGIDGIYKLNKTTGEVICSQTAGSDGISQSLAQSDSMIYGGSSGWGGHNHMHAFNKSDCSIAWEYPVPAATGVPTSPLYYDNTVTFGAYGGTNHFVQVNATTGALIWSKTYGGGAWDIHPSIKDGVIYVGSYTSNYIAALDFATGNQIWSNTTVGAFFTPMAIYDNKLWAGGTNHKVYALNLSDGSKFCESYNAGGDVFGISVVQDELGNGYTVFTSRDGGSINLIKTSDCSLVWKYNIGAWVYSTPTIAKGKMYVATDDWNVYAFDMGTGVSEWKYFGYNSDGVSFCPDCLTSWKKVTSICTTAGAVSTCNVENSYLGRAIETKMDMQGSTVVSAILPSGDHHIFVEGDTVYLPKMESTDSITGLQITTGAAYDPVIPLLSGITPTTANVLEASYDSTADSISLSFDNSATVDADISDFKRPFTNATSTITSTDTTSISATGLTGITDMNSVKMDVAPSSDSVDIDIDTWETSGSYYKKWTEGSEAVIATTTHTVGDLEPNTNYNVRIDNVVFGNYLSNGSGEITFIYDGGYSTKTFEIGNTPAAPTIDTPTTLSSSSIQWNFTDTASDETGFKLYDNLDNLISTTATPDISSIDESGLSENTQYTRYVKAYNGYADSTASANASIYSFADTPSNLAVAEAEDGENQVSVDQFLNDTSDFSGYYFSSSSGNYSGWINTNSWQDTGLNCDIEYTYSVKYRNGDGVETDETSLLHTNACIETDTEVLGVTTQATATPTPDEEYMAYNEGKESIETSVDYDKNEGSNALANGQFNKQWLLLLVVPFTGLFSWYYFAVGKGK